MINKAQIAFLLLIVIPLTACQSKQKDSVTMNKSEATVQTDLATLKRLVALPLEPISAKWVSANMIKNTGQSPGPDDWGLLAVLDFDSPAISELLAKQSSLTNVEIPSSLPLTSLLETNFSFTLDSKKQYYVFGGQAKNADLFFKEPLLKGAFFLLGERTVLLYLHTQ